MGVEFLSPLFISLKISLAATVLASPFAVYFGWLIGGKKLKNRQRVFVEILVMSPMMISPVIVGYFFLNLFSPNGLFGSMLHEIGITVVFDQKGIILAQALIGMPLYVQAVSVNLSLIDVKLEWISRSMGYGRAATFFKVYLPLCKKGILSGFLLCFVRSMGEFGASNVIGGGFSEETETIPLAVYRVLNTPGGESSLFLLIGISVSITVIFLVLIKLTLHKIL